MYTNVIVLLHSVESIVAGSDYAGRQAPQMEIEEKVAKALLTPLDSEPDVLTQYLLRFFPVLDASLAKLHSTANLEDAARSPSRLRVWQ